MNHLLPAFLLAALAAGPSAPPRDPLATAAAVDREINQRLAEAKLPASPVCDDAEFIRRLSLDVRGRIPSAERTVAFLADRDPNKRRKLIDEFLESPLYGEHFAIIWYHRMVKPTMDNDKLISPVFQNWLSVQFNRNRHWDQVVTDILTASGERERAPATVFWLAHVEGNKQREVIPARVTASATRLFLGVRLECCECHNHPFDGKLKQIDFWSLAAFFAGTHASHASKKDTKADAVPAIHEAPHAAGKKGKQAEPSEPAPFGLITIPDSKGKMVRARFLDGDTPSTAGKSQLRPTFAAWLTSAKNPYFARAAVNKLWANFFGRGLVNPIDDMRADSTNTHPQLLELLAGEFAAAGFDQKHLIRCLCNSQTYQRTTQTLAENKSDEELYSHMPLKVMSADMLYDSLTAVLEHPVATREREKKKGVMQPREVFRNFFHAEADDDAGVVDDYGHGIPQVLRLMNSGQVTDTGPVVAKLMKTTAGGTSRVIEAIYVRVLSRPPTAAESARAEKYVAGSPDAGKGYGDLLWALLNSSEFLFNH